MLELPQRPRSPGRGALVVARAGGRSVVARAVAESPLKLLLPRCHGDARWAFVATFGGGLVDGDRIELDVRVERGARALVATQSSTKVYRSPRLGAHQNLVASVAEGALLAIVPDPTVCFAGARYEQVSAFSLARGGSLVTLDFLSCGRSARGERWAFEHFAARTRIEREGAPLATEAIVLDPAHGALGPRMGRWDAIATAFAFGPETATLRSAFLDAARQAPAHKADLVLSASPIGEDGAVLRVAAARVELATIALRAVLRDLGRAFGDDPFARKW